MDKKYVNVLFELLNVNITDANHHLFIRTNISVRVCSVFGIKLTKSVWQCYSYCVFHSKIYY